jgi:16S rRNA (uracil1498-N3)-methyltransferase
MSRVWRAYHPQLPGERGATIALSPEEAHHVHRVLRLAPGAALRVFDGAGAEWSGVVSSATSREVVVRLVEPYDEPALDPSLPVVLLQGWCRPERTDWIVQKATELGVASIGLLARRACGRRPTLARAPRALARIAIEACKQCGRRRVPAVEVVDELPELPAGTLGMMPDPAPAHPSLGRLLATERPRPVMLAIGPEGGFTAEELSRATARGLRPGLARPAHAALRHSGDRGGDDRGRPLGRGLSQSDRCGTGA